MLSSFVLHTATGTSEFMENFTAEFHLTVLETFALEHVTSFLLKI